MMVYDSQDLKLIHFESQSFNNIMKPIVITHHGGETQECRRTIAISGETKHNETIWWIIHTSQK